MKSIYFLATGKPNFLISFNKNKLLFLVFAVFLGLYAKENCPAACPKVYRPVCGCATFDNFCEMEIHNCTVEGSMKFL